MYNTSYSTRFFFPPNVLANLALKPTPNLCAPLTRWRTRRRLRRRRRTSECFATSPTAWPPRTPSPRG
eukprot:578476-Pyramimonas_sp.AAC.2